MLLSGLAFDTSAVQCQGDMKNVRLTARFGSILSTLAQRRFAASSRLTPSCRFVITPPCRPI